MRRLSLPLSLGLLFSLACFCGGPSVDTEAHLRQVCAEGGEVITKTPLLPLDRASTPLPSLVRLELQPGEALVDGWEEALSPEHLSQTLAERAEQARLLGEYSDTPFDGTLLLLVSPEVPASEVRDAVHHAHAGGFVSLALAFRSPEPHELPPYPDPAYAAELQARLADVPLDTRQMIAAEELSGLIALCPPAQEVFSAIAVVSADQKCELIARGMDEALGPCVATDADAVVTALHVLSEPSSTHRPTVLRLGLDPDSEVVIEASGTWAELGPALAALEGQTAWIP